MAAIVIYMVTPIAAVHWILQPSPGLTFDPNLVSSDVDHENWPSNQIDPPIAYPERLVAIDGKPVYSQKEYNRIIVMHGVGDIVALTFEQPPSKDDHANARPDSLSSRTVKLPIVEHSISELVSMFGILYLTGAIVLLIGIWTFRLRPEKEETQIFALFTVTIAILTATTFDGVSTHYFNHLWIVGIATFGSFNLWLNLLFPEPIKWFKEHAQRGLWLFVPSALLIVWSYSEIHDVHRPWAYVQPWLAAYTFNGILMSVALIIMVYRAIWSPSPLIRQQGKIILLGAVLAFTPVFVFFVSYATTVHLSWLTPTLIVAPITIYPLVIAYTIVRYQMMDVDVVMQRGITYTLLISVLLIIVYAIALLLHSFISFDSPFMVVITTLLVVLLLNPLQKQLQTNVDRYIFNQPVSLDILARQYGQELATAVSVDRISNALLAYSLKGIPDSTPTLFLPDETLNAYQGTNGRFIDRNYPLISIFEKGKGCFDLTTTGSQPAVLEAYVEEVNSFNAAIIAPINAGGRLLGWLTISSKENGKRLHRADIIYIDTLVNQTWIGLERANIVRNLETRISELDILSQFSAYLSFTQDQEMMVELIYTNFQRLLGIRDMCIYLRHLETGNVYKIFHVEDDERYESEEQETVFIDDPLVHEVIRTGKTVMREDKNGRFQIATPLYAGSTTIGALTTQFRQPGIKLRDRQRQLFDVFTDHTAVALERLRTNHQLKNRARQLEKINQLTLDISSTLEMDSLLSSVLDNSIELLNAEAGTFMLAIEDTGELEFAVVRGPTSDNLIGKRLPIGVGLAGTVAQSGRPIIVHDASEDKRWFSNVDQNSEFHTESLLTVPLLRKNSIVGVLQIINKKNGSPFNEEDQQVLMTFAGQAVLAMENVRLLEQTDKQLGERVNELSMLQQLDRDLNVTLEIDHVLNLMLDWSLRVANGTAGTIAIVNDDGHLDVFATRGYNNMPQLTRENVNSSLSAHVMQTWKPHLSGDVHKEDKYVSASTSTHSQMTLPIIHKQNLIGVASIESDKLNAFTQKDLDMAMRMTNHAAVAIANALLYEEVKEANRAKSEFVSMVSHELKTPMTSMRGYTDLMLAGMTGELNAQQTEFLGTIQANLKRMGRQIQDLTDVSRIETGQLAVELTTTHFSTIISETLQTVTGPCTSKGIELNLNLPSDLPPVWGDTGRLVQVLTNLLSNACKYSPENTTVTITIHAKEISCPEDTPPRPMVICVVQDEGYGMSEEDVEKLFTKFFRSSNPDIRKATGTGLGLVISQGLVELHNGRMWVESTLGIGTTFSFAIPQANNQS